MRESESFKSSLKHACLKVLKGESQAYTNLVYNDLKEYYKANHLSLDAFFPTCRSLPEDFTLEPTDIEIRLVDKHHLLQFIRLRLTLFQNEKIEDVITYEFILKKGNYKCRGDIFVGRAGEGRKIVFPKADTAEFMILEDYIMRVYNPMLSKHLVGKTKHDPNAENVSSINEAITLLSDQKKQPEVDVRSIDSLITLLKSLKR